MTSDDVGSRPVISEMASLGLWTFPFCSLARISSTFCSVASLPIESTPLFFLGWNLNGVGPVPPLAATTTTARRQGPPVGRRARGTWTTNLDFVQKTLHLGATLLATEDGLNEYPRHRMPGLLVPHSASCHATPKEPTHAVTARLARSALRQHVANLPASRSVFTSTAPPAASASLGTASVPFSRFRPVRSFAQGHGYWNQDPG